jgi:hypothetical protein
VTTMDETDALLSSALRRYISAAVRDHPDSQQFERAFQRRELILRLEYESATQAVQVSGINQRGEAFIISSRTLGS